jgi:hypothetical protein
MGMHAGGSEHAREGVGQLPGLPAGLRVDPDTYQPADPGIARILNYRSRVGIHEEDVTVRVHDGAFENRLRVGLEGLKRRFSHR